MGHQRSAGAVIFRESGRSSEKNGERLYLLLQYTAGHWGLSRGHIEEGEDEKETIRREADEETGITDLEFVDGFREKTHFYFRRGGETIRKDLVILLAETETEEVVLGSPHEHQDYAWLPYEEAVERATFENAEELIRKAEEFLNERR